MRHAALATALPRSGRALVAGLSLLALAALLTAAPAAAETPAENPAAHDYFGDTTLIDQEGREHRFYSDLMAGKVVVINAFFTSCTGSCPVMAGHLVKVQEWLGDRLGEDVRLISISVDPKNDTQERVKAYSERFGARPGWYFLTGDEANVNEVLRKLGQYVDEPAAHTSIMMIGNVPTGLWKKVQGLAQPGEIIQILDGVVRDQGPEEG